MSSPDSAHTDMSLKSLLKQFVDRGLNRRQFLSRLTAIGVSAASARSLAAEYAPIVLKPSDDHSEATPSWARRITGTGGRLVIEQLKAAGCKYIFTTPSSGETPIYDALVDDSDIQLIQVLQEGSVAAVADGYGRATGTVPFVLVPRPGLENAMAQMFNAWKDFTPMVIMVDDVAVPLRAQDGFETADHLASMTAPITKWYWSIETTERIPELLRRAFKFASTKPYRPVFLACPEDLLSHETTATVIDQDRFDVSTELRLSSDAVIHIARLLVDARNPVIYAGDDVRYCGAQAELLGLAELLSIPVTTNGWSRTFPTDHALFAGRYTATAPYPGKADVVLILSSRFQSGRLDPDVRLIQIGLDSTDLARVVPVELAVIADVRLALADIVPEVRRIAPDGYGNAVSQRLQRAKDHQEQRRSMLQYIRQQRWNDSPPSSERVCAEIDAALPKNALVVSDGDTYRSMVEDDWTYGPDARDLYATDGGVLGWGLPAAIGVKLAHPNRPVVALISDGSFLFSGPQALWSYARYRAPITVIVLNNQSYNAERNRAMEARGRQYQTGRDMVCYLGDPDIEYSTIAAGFGVRGEAVREPDELSRALVRAWQENGAGKPYLIDVRVQRTGSLSTSSWHPQFYISALGVQST